MLRPESHCNWHLHLPQKLFIAGPCGAESHEQVQDTIMGLDAQKYAMIRAGVWKPRTRPGSFEGMGIKALQWLKDVSLMAKKPFMVEVANPEHVAVALDYAVDAVWIGARTTVNPFMVQELAESLQDAGIPVFIKNPISPDLELWIGAIQRFLNVGVTQLAAIHRGFYAYNKQQYRNNPYWSIALELKQQYPTLSLICDPSHIAGVRLYVEPLAQEAMDLHFDGLMIETHIDPGVALSDAAQQLTPDSYNKLIGDLQLKPANSNDLAFNQNIKSIREKIDDCDSRLLQALSERLGYVNEIAALKKTNFVSTLQLDRWNEIMKTRKEEALKLGLNEDLVHRLLTLLHQESIKIHQK